MRLSSLALTFALTACQAVTDPCFQGENYEGPDRCAGEIQADLTASPPQFWVEGTTDVYPDEFSMGIAEGDPCDGHVQLWELTRLGQTDTITYAEVPQRAREWTNEDLLQNGALPPLEAGQTYVVSFHAGDRLGPSGTGNSDWTGAFVAGEVDSFHLLTDRCN